jgi:hypothetical protein
MPGYAYPVGAVADSGRAGSISSSISVADTYEVIVPAVTVKTKINSILVVNKYGGILPVDIRVSDDSESTSANLVDRFRVHKRRYALQSLVSGDTRTQDDTVGDDLITTEVVLSPGDFIEARCPIGDDNIDIIVTYSEGVK